jgi:hypothetical protein
MNYFVFKPHIFGFQQIGQQEIQNMVSYKTKTFKINYQFISLAIYLIKRTLRNRQRHGLEEHEMVC